MRFTLFIFISLFMASCSLLPNAQRSPASTQTSCLDMATDILDDQNLNVDNWSASKVSKVFENSEDLSTFYRYVDGKYPTELREKIGNLAGHINNYHQQRIYTNFFVQLEMAKRSAVMNFPAPEQNWAKGSWAYLYVDKFGVEIDGQHATFDDLLENLDFYKEKLKVKNLYLLPINKSPKMDGGYDVADYKVIDELIGGNDGFKRFIQSARAKDMNVMVDFVPGHISKEHPWFKKALAGEEKYREYFLNSPVEINGNVIQEGGNVYNVYKTSDGTEYKRLVLFPDLETKHWHKETMANGSNQWFYSSFYPFQKDLNLQNPDVLSEHLNTLGWWINQGVNGIRADAISWWVKKEGTSGQHLDETLSISEYFNTFLKYLNRDSVFLPELVDSPETAARYLGKTENINGSIGGSNSNSVFEFEKSVQIFYAGVSGDFSDHYKFLNRTRSIVYPDNTQSILYSANHHDEIYLGFLSENSKSSFQHLIKESGGVVYKEGNSGGAMLADLLDFDQNKMFQFYKFLFAHKGSVAVYQGAALGLGNAWKETYLTTFKQLDEMVSAGQLPADHAVFAEVRNLKANPSLMENAPSESSAILPLIDGRLLHRNNMTQEMLTRAMNGDNDFFNSFSKLPTLKESNPALNGAGNEEPLDSMRSDIGSFMRRAYNMAGSLDQEVAVVKNGTSQRTTVKLNRSQLTNKQQFSLKELESGSNYNYSIVDDGHNISISLEPYETLWLEVN